MFELMTTLHTKLEGFHTQISKDSPERGHVAKPPHVRNYQKLVCKLDEAEVPGPWPMAMYICNTCAVVYDIILKNPEKLKNPKGETKGMMY